MGQYRKWIIGFGLVIAIISSLMINTALDNTGDVAVNHYIRKREDSQQNEEKANEIINIFKSNPGEAGRVYNSMPDQVRLAILPTVIKQSYREERFVTMMFFAAKIQKKRNTEIPMAVKYWVEEMKSRQQINNLTVLLIDCYVSSTALSDADQNIIADINNQLKDPVENVLTSLAEQIIEANVSEGSLLQNLLTAGDKRCPQYSGFKKCYTKYFTKVVQRAYKANENVINNIIKFAESLGTSCPDYFQPLPMTGVVLRALAKEMEQSGTNTQSSQIALIKAVIKLLIMPKYSAEDDKMELIKLVEKLGHNLKDEIYNATAILIERGAIDDARRLYRNIPSLNDSEFMDRTYEKLPFDKLFKFSGSGYSLTSLDSVLEALLDQMIDHKDYKDDIFSVANYQENEKVMKKIVELATNLAYLPIREGNFSFMPLLRPLDASYIGEIVKGVYEPNEDTELNLVTFADKLNKELNNAAGSAKAYLQLHIEMEKHEHMKLRPMMSLVRMVDLLRKDGQFKASNAPEVDKIHNLWLGKLPWDLKCIESRESCCLVNKKYSSDHLVYRTMSVMSVPISNPGGPGLKWVFVGNATHFAIIQKAHHQSLKGTNEMMRCTSGRRKVDATLSLVQEYNWEIHDYDWKKNLYMLYNVEYKEYLYTDDPLRLKSPVGRHVYLGKLQNPVNPAAVWRISQC